MKLNIYQIDAFAEKAFEGNPAAIIPLEAWLPDQVMQSIAQENNLSETAFFVPSDVGYDIRWFTPSSEVKLCGHATLASAFVLFDIFGLDQDVVTFDSQSGGLSVAKNDGLLTMNFPSQKPEQCDIPQELIDGLGGTPIECYKNEDYIAVFHNHADIKNIEPNHSYLEKLDLRGVIVTAASDDYDFVARFFAPKFGIPEDPVTGSAYTQLTPYWSEKMGKTKFSAKQVSARGGKVVCDLNGDRVLISGSAAHYMKGTIEVEL